MTGPYRVLPILQGLCAQIDELYIEEVGPFGRMVILTAIRVSSGR